MSTKQMNSDNNSHEIIYCDDDGSYRVFCNICDKLCIGRLYKNHLKSSTRSTIIRTRQQLNNMNKKT